MLFVLLAVACRGGQEEGTKGETGISAFQRSTHRTSPQALVMAHACSNVILDRTEEALKNGVVGNEDDDW